MSYKIIEIIDEHNVLVNFGGEEGAEEGMLLNIIIPGEPVIIDDKNYGTFDRIKETIVIETVYPKFSLCQKQITTTYDLFSPFTNLKRNSTQIARININPSQKTNRQLPLDAPVVVGDIVVKKY